MIVSFKDEGTRDIFSGRDTRAARKTCPQVLWRVAGKRLDALDDAELLSALAEPPGHRLEQLKGDRAGQHSIRVNARYRVCFSWNTSGPAGVEIVDYH